MSKFSLHKKKPAIPKNVSEALVYVKGGKEALWYREWGKADYLFEQAIKFDAKNAEAPLGLKLAQSQCKNLEVFVEERKKIIAGKKLSYETLCAGPEIKEKIDAAVAKFTHNDIVTENEILAAFYPALDVASRLKISEKIESEEKDFWENDELFLFVWNSEDEQVKEKLASAYKNITDMLESELNGLYEENKKCELDTDECRKISLKAVDDTYEKLLSKYQENLQTNYDTAVQIQDESVSQYGFQNAERHFKKLGDYKDAASRAEECPQKAEEIIEKKRLSKRKKRNRWIIACASVLAAIGIAIGLHFITTDKIMPPKNYNNGLEALKNGDKRMALFYFDKADGYADSVELAKPLRKELVQKSVIDAAGMYTIAIEEDGTVKASGILPQLSKHSSGKNIEEWENIVSVAANWDHVVGLKADGTVEAVGQNANGRCNVGEWKNIIAIDAGGTHTVGLKSDGTVVAAGDNTYGQCDVEKWENIIAIAAGGWHTVGLKSDGTVVATGKNNYPELAVRYRRDQIIKGHKLSEHKPCNVGGWKDIIAITAGASHTVGLKSDGTVVAAGFNGYTQCETQKWEDVVAVSAGDYLTMALNADGTVRVIGWNSYKECSVSDMKDITAIAAGFWHTVAIKSDGTAIARGNNRYGQCEVEDWRNIRTLNYN